MIFLKIGTFARRFERLRLKKFSEILNSNATLNKFPVHRINITFKHKSFVHAQAVSRAWAILCQPNL